MKQPPLDQSSNDSTKSVVTINNQKYEITSAIANSSGAVPLPVGTIQQLIIRDSLFSPFAEGELIIDSTNNPLDNFVKKTTNELGEITQIKSLFTFNHDSQDTFIVKLEPLMAKQGSVKMYGMLYVFCIVDEDEELVKEGNKKRKIFYLKDARQQFLETANVRWSTADAVYRSLKRDNFNINLSQAGNTARELDTGLAIKDFLETVLGDSYKPTFNERWPSGGTTTFYSSPNTSSALDDLETLLDSHIGDAPHYGKDVLKLQKNNEWALHSLSDLLRFATGKDNNTYGPGLSDIFHISGKVINSNNSFIPASNKQKPGTGNFTKKFPGLETYKFLNTVMTDTAKELASITVHAYDSYFKQFSIDGKDTHVEKLREEFQRLYADVMKGEIPTAIFPVNKNKTENKINMHVFSTGSDQKERKADGINRVMTKAINFAPGINFTTEGSTHRESGKIISLFNDNNEDYSAADKLLSGDWLITNINHVFLLAQNQYLNDITCIKTYTSEPLVPAGTTDLPGAVPLQEGQGLA